MRLWVYWIWTKPWAETDTDTAPRWIFSGYASDGSVALIDQKFIATSYFYERTIVRGLYDFETQFYRKWVWLP